MRILGVEFASSNMNYVGIEDDGNSQIIITANRVILGSTRDRDALIAFQKATQTLLNDFAPDYIAIKLKPESGKMRGGAAAIKMEGILLANAPCEIEFISGQKINKLKDGGIEIYAYLQTALKAALVVCKLKAE